MKIRNKIFPRRRNKVKIFNLFIISASLFTINVFADPVIINNNTGQTPTNQVSSAAPQYQCPPGNQNNIYDPRIPPAGVYRNKDSTTYTTGEKTPYYVDNGCNNNTAPVIQPYVNTPSPPIRNHLAK